MNYRPYLTLCTRNPLNRPACNYLETIVLRHPDFARWCFDEPQVLNEEYAPFRETLDRIVAGFDAMPLTMKCRRHTQGCTRPATRFRLYTNEASMSVWCDTCDPLQNLGDDMYAIGTTYYEAMDFSTNEGMSRLKWRRIVRNLCNAKGLTGNFTEGKIAHFLYADEVAIANAEPQAPA